MPEPNTGRLPSWPYDWLTVENRLDPAIIVEQGEFLLYRALNTRRVVGFVGSGVSAAYGRVTWTELALFHIDTLLRFFPGPPLSFDVSDPRANVRTQLKAMLERKCDKGSTVLLAMQLCEQMWCLSSLDDSNPAKRLDHLCAIFDLKMPTTLPARQPELGRDLFRSWIKRETHDELPHILRVLTGTLIAQSGTPAGERSRFRDALLSIAKGPSPNEDQQARAALFGILKDLTEPRRLLRSSAEKPKRAYARLFAPHALSKQREFVRKLRTKSLLPTDVLANPVLDTIDSLLAVMARAGNSISPIRYFGLGLVLDLWRVALARWDNDAVAEFICLLLEISLKQEGSENGGLPTRSQIIDPSCDPLHRLVYDLQFKRFATTNYDLEIERFFFDMGFVPAEFPFEDDAPPPDSIRVGSVGARTRDIVLTEETTVDLLDFATDDARYSLELVHLHGRATEDSEILITERDYQFTYLRDGASQQAFRQGLDITFGGNPILFIGQGMSEGDVLRPLREFVSVPSRRNRAIIALRDSTEDGITRDAFTMDQFAKYGVHIIHYGFLTNAEGVRRNARREGKDESWLYSILEVIRTIQTSMAELSKRLWPLSPDVADRDHAIRVFEQAINPIKFRDAIELDLSGADSKLDDFWSDGGPLDIKFEILTLEQVTCLLQSAVSRVSRDPNCADDILRALFQEIVPVALERIKASLLTVALNAKLEGIRKGWLKWWIEWRIIPGDRSRFMSYAKLNATADLSLWGRHIPQTPDPRNKEERLPYPPSFRYPRWLPPTRDDRRCMILTAPKGYGKGYLFSFLAKTLQISKMRGDQDKYIGQFFHNFSFATEIASVWDALAIFLAAPREFPAVCDSEHFNRALGISPDAFINMSRIERLEWSLDRLEKAGSGRTRNRALVAFNAADILFDERGEPKHFEIGRLLDLLLGTQHLGAPLDIIFSVRDGRFPSRFQRKIQDPEAEKTDDCATRLRLLLPSNVGNTPLEFAAAQHVVATMRRANANLIGFDPPPLTANQLATGDSEVIVNNEKNFVYVLPVPKPQHFLPERMTPAGARLPFLGNLLTRETEDDNSGPPDEVTRLIAAAIDGQAVPEEQTFEIVSEFLRQKLGSNTYAFTLVRAIAEEILREPDGNESVLSAEKIWQLRRVVEPIQLDMESFSATPPGDHFYELILDFWYKRDACGKSGELNSPNLLESLLRHIAVIAGPIEAEVLAECPLIAEQISQIVRSGSADGTSQSTSANQEIAVALANRALATLFERRLVFRIEPHSHKLGEFRYQVHRSIQTHVYRKLGSQAAEPSEGYIFAPSLYVAQTRTLPRLHATSYKFLYELVDSLICYPPRSAHLSVENRNDRTAPLHANCLRAALGVVRTLFSLGIVTRFADADILPVPKPPQIGYLEHHRLAIRWMLKLACWLEDKVSDTTEPTPEQLDLNLGASASILSQGIAKQVDRPRRSPEWPPFYRDEIVWLYNECGVFSLAQGQCFDARALFEQALREQARIDGVDHGAMRHRILFNAGLCAIDRGALGHARRAFDEIEHAPNVEPMMGFLAQGFSAHIDHIAGRVDIALKGFADSIRGLEKLRHLRPLAILYCHRGDLHRQRGNIDSAIADFSAGAEHASAGSYADLIHYAQIGTVRTRVSPRRTTLEIQEAMHQLQAAEDYADRMDLPRLKCEVMFIRGEVQINQGEMTLAGQLVTRAVRIANLNGLALRKIAGLQLLAEIHRARGDAKGADRLNARIAQAARDIGYHLLVSAPLTPSSDGGLMDRT